MFFSTKIHYNRVYKKYYGVKINMGKILVIAEKPSVAVDYAKALSQTKREAGYFEGDKYIITWAVGHIVSRKELYEYDPNINRASQNREHVLSTLPYFPQKHILKLALKNTERFKNDKARLAIIKRDNDGLKEREATIKKLFNRNDIDFVVNGCDAGREGEAIFYQIYDFLECSLPVKRLWLSSNGHADIRKAFTELKDGSEYHNLKEASYARAEMDWEHGLNLSALYSSLYGAQLSVGRVQTPVLNMIVERELEINNFKPEDYFLIDAEFSTTDNFKYTGKLIIDDSLGEIVSDGKIKDISAINNIVNSIENKQGYIDSINKTKKTESPKLLFNLSDLQKELGNKHKLTSIEVLNTAQSLYETHKLITYPRTSSNYLNESMREEVLARIDYLPPQYDNIVKYAKNSGCFFDKVFNDKKVEDHYGLIPTVASKTFDFTKLNERETLVYTTILKRFIALFLPNHEYESTVITTKVDDYKFKTTGKKITQVGWKSLYTASNDAEDSKDEDNQDLTYNFNEKITILCDKANKQSKKTQPPKRYTDPSLVAAMEVGGVKSVSMDIDDPDKLDMLKQKGLGTEATRAHLIENIINRGYVERFKKINLIPTQKGIDFINRISVEKLKSPEITGEWEYKLKLIEKGKLDKKTLISEAREFVKNCIEDVKANYKEGDRISDFEKIDAKCPLCGGAIQKSPKVYFCENSSSGCKFTVFAIICKKKIKDSDVKDICKNGVTKVIKGFTSPNQKDSNGKPLKFDACLLYNKEQQKLIFTRPGASAPKERKETDFICPKCGKPIMEFETGYGCSGFKDGCRFSFFKKLFNITLTQSDISDLLEKGETKIFSELVNPKKPSNTFSAKLVLGNEAPEIIYLNKNNEPDIAKPTSHFCPICGKTINEFERYFKCSACNFAVNKHIAGATISDDIIREICVEKRTTSALEFISTSNKPFKARLIVNNKTKKLEFELDTKASNYKCPLCGSSVGEGENNYKCLNKKCGLTVWKSIGSTILDDKSISDIFKNKETSEYLDLVSAKGKPYRAKLIVNAKTKKIEFFFESKK